MRSYYEVLIPREDKHAKWDLQFVRSRIFLSVSKYAELMKLLDNLSNEK